VECYYCKKEIDPGDLRPYGPKCEFICEPCGTLPGNESTTFARFKEQLFAAENVNKDLTGESVVRIGSMNGPYPVKLEDMK